MRLIWCLSHDTSTKDKILQDNDIVGALGDAKVPEASVISHCAFYLGFQKSGKFLFVLVLIV